MGGCGENKEKIKRSGNLRANFKIQLVPAKKNMMIMLSQKREIPVLHWGSTMKSALKN